MALYTSAQASSTHGKRPSMSMYGGANASLLIEKTKSDIRHSTPDSEALASSDDEQDQHHQLPFVNNPHNLRSIRRSSWLNDSQQVLQRGASLSGGGTFSSGIPYSTTPAAESWTSTAGSSNNVAVGRSHANSASFPWGNALWNVDSPKGPPSRLTEVLPSPTTTNPSDARLPSDDTPISSSIRRESVAESAIPFAIPLHPTPKTYRSQSYSVGQLDPELVHGLPGQMQHFYPGRTRAGSSYTGLQHRPSRPSMLSDVTYDTSVLSQLREVEDDEESTSDRSEVEMPLTDTQARTIKRLAMENALLRQAAATNYLREPHMSRTPHMTDTDSSNMKEGFEKQRETNEVTFEDADCPRTGIHQTNHSRVLNQYSNVGQSFGEYNTDERGKFSSSLILDNRKTESVKKGVWQSSLGFGGYASVPQSRRHSFAAVPTHHNSISSVDHTKNNHAGMQEENILHHDMRLASGFEDKSVNELHGGNSEYINSRLQFALQEQHLEEENLHSQIYAASYFSKVSPASRNTDIRPQINPSSFVPQDLARGTAHHRHQHLIPPQAYHGQSLYVVTFKACRADFYYVQEGTGLHVKNGDLVIVEADRGADLGTVAHENIDWAAARSLKEHYAREHYRWLMMFSRHEQRGFSASFHSNPLALPHGVNAGATTGMGSARQSTTSEPFDLDTKPKMIKRLAQAHEIQTLRDKEANEAKAKRTCQQKVAEHHLQMEILDAEFQMQALNSILSANRCLQVNLGIGRS